LVVRTAAEFWVDLRQPIGCRIAARDPGNK
jgi:hypothetical protein